MKLVYSVFISDDINVYHFGNDFKIGILNFERSLGLSKPALLFDPVVLLCGLRILFKDLFEKSEVIIKSDSVSGKSKCCDGIKETCGKSSESAVTK